MIIEVKCGSCRVGFTVLDCSGVLNCGALERVQCPDCSEPVEVPRLAAESRAESNKFNPHRSRNRHPATQTDTLA